MTTMNNTSAMRAADPVYRGHLANVTSSGSAAFTSLENPEAPLDHTAPTNSHEFASPEVAAEAQDAPPVAGSPDWFEIAGLSLVAEGHISETRFRRAMNAVRQGVDRA